MDINIRALQMRRPESTDLHRYDEVAKILTGKQNAQAADGIAWAQELCSGLDIASLSSYGMTADDIPGIVCKSTRTSGAGP